MNFQQFQGTNNTYFSLFQTQQSNIMMKILCLIPFMKTDKVKKIISEERKKLTYFYNKNVSVDIQ